MSDELRAAEALAALRAVDIDRIEYKAAIENPVLDIEDRDVTTLYSVHGVLDRVGDITEPGVFEKSIKERGKKIPHIWFHDDRAPSIASIQGFRSLSRNELPEEIKAQYPDATGADAVISRYLKTPRADEIFQGLKEGVPYEASFGFKTLRATRESLPDGQKARRLREARLLEITTCPPGSAINTATTAWIGKALAALEQEQASIKAGRRHSRSDIELLREIARMAYELGADNIELIKEAIDQAAEDASAAPPSTKARTDHAERVMASIATILGRT